MSWDLDDKRVREIAKGGATELERKLAIEVLNCRAVREYWTHQVEARAREIVTLEASIKVMTSANNVEHLVMSGATAEIRDMAQKLVDARRAFQSAMDQAAETVPG